MILDGYSIQEKGIVTFNEELDFDTEDQIQPNGLDLRAQNIYYVQGSALIPREGPAQAKLTARLLDLKDGYWQVTPQKQGLYYVDFAESIYVHDGFCGIINTRSSLVRSGIDLMAGVYDCGFKGRLGANIRAYSDVTIEFGAKLGQILLYKVNFRGHRYSGRYMNTNSQSAIINES